MVYNDINESPYKFTYYKLTFYFSSLFYLSNFKKKYLEFLKDETVKLKIKFRCYVSADYMILLLLYKKIEKRGFKVLYNDIPINENYYITDDIDAISYKD